MVSVSDLFDAFVVELLVTAAFLGLAYIRRAWIRTKVLNVIYYLTNSEIHISAKRVDTFKDTEQDILVDSFATNIFPLIKENYRKEITNPDYQGHRLEVKIEDIPTDIVIKLEEEIEPTGMELSPEPVGYKAIVETENEIRMGYRSVDSLREFERFADDATQIIKSEYFPESVSDTSVVQVELKNGVPAGVDEIEDSGLGLSASLKGSTLYMTFREPRNIVEGVRKYFQPRPFRPT